MISAIVLTKNDEKLIRGCLESLTWVDEIVIFDNASHDQTLEIAKRYDAKIFSYKGQDFSEHRNLAFEKTKGDWVLYVDSDERVLNPLKEEILDLVSTTSCTAFALPRINIIFGKNVNYGPYKCDRMVRLFNKKKFKKWVGKIHEHALFDGDLGYTKNYLLHLTHRNLDQIVLKSLNWSHFDAKLRFEVNHPKMTGWRFLRIFITETCNQLIKRKGLFGGTIGMMDSLLQVFSLYMSYIRLWEMQQTKSRDQVYEEIDKNLIESGFNY